MFFINPAKMKQKMDINALTRAYGSCVNECTSGPHPALVAVIMVVSEIGDALSPKAAPESIAAKDASNILVSP